MGLGDEEVRAVAVLFDQERHAVRESAKELDDRDALPDPPAWARATGPRLTDPAWLLARSDCGTGYCTPWGYACEAGVSTTAEMCPLDYGGSGDGCQPPNLITLLINIALQPGSVDEPLYKGQAALQNFLLLAEPVSKRHEHFHIFLGYCFKTKFGYSLLIQLP